MFSATGQYSWGVTIEEIQTFVGKVSQVTTTAVGGPYVAGMTLEQWQTAAEQTPGILEYWLSSTSNYIDPIFFPQRNSTTIQYVKSTYENPWIAYLNNNSKFGCTDKFAVNFHLDSTVDDGTCVYDYQTTSSFAGLYMIEVYTDDSGTSTKYYDNPFTNAPACPTGSFAICQSFSDWVDLTICTCEGGSNPAFGGVFSTGANNDFFNIDSANNVVTGATSCATGTSALPINGINICAGNNATSWTYGGAYYYNGDGCTPNPQTNQCTCPDASYAVVSIGVEVQSQWGSINLCVTLPSQQTNPNPGSYPNYVAMKVSNVTWVIPTQTPTTPSPTTPFPTTQLPIPPRPTSPPPPSSMSPPDWIYPVILGVGILVILVGGMVAIYFRCRPQAEYTPIQ